MALDARQRSSIYHSLVPILGDDDANALMSEFPALEADELVTKQFLRAELAQLRTDLARLESRVLVRMGAAMAAQTTVLLAAIGLLR